MQNTAYPIAHFFLFSKTTLHCFYHCSQRFCFICALTMKFNLIS